jgi:hypothetical protein
LRWRISKITQTQGLSDLFRVPYEKSSMEAPKKMNSSPASERPAGKGSLAQHTIVPITKPTNEARIDFLSLVGRAAASRDPEGLSSPLCFLRIVWIRTIIQKI